MEPRDYRAIGQAIGGDLTRFITDHPDAFDILLIKPVQGSEEVLTDTEDVAGSIEAEERTMTYQDPILSRAVIVPADVVIPIDDLGEDPDGNNMEQPVVLLILDPDVPRQSVVQFDEYVEGGNLRVVTLYVLRSENIGQAPGAGKRHFCFPFQAFDFEFVEPPVNLSPVDGAEEVGETPTLEAGPFAVRGTDDTHEKSQWQIRTDVGDYDDPAWDSGESADLTSTEVPAGIFADDGIYHWRVRYMGKNEVWSDWSDETSFTV